jgi:hypothetical protein
MTLEDLITDFLSSPEDLEKVVAGSPIEVEKLSKVKARRTMWILLHCCINGPVSPHKKTTFPVIGETSLDDEVGSKVTNSALKASCSIIAKSLQASGFDKGSQYEQFKTFWPLY